MEYRDAQQNTARVQAEAVLIATGRSPNAEPLFVGSYRPEIVRGAIVANEAGCTSLPHLYVIGDAKAGNIQLAHLAEAQGKNVVAYIWASRCRWIPLWCPPVYTQTRRSPRWG